MGVGTSTNLNCPASRLVCVTRHHLGIQEHVLQTALQTCTRHEEGIQVFLFAHRLACLDSESGNRVLEPRMILQSKPGLHLAKRLENSC